MLMVAGSASVGPSLERPLARLVAGLDAVRGWLLRALTPWSSRLAADREARVAVVATTTVLLSFAAAMLSPLALLALGPILLGVPHLLADVRYCVVRPGWYRDRKLQLAALPVVAVGLGADLTVGLAGVGAAVVAADAGPRRRMIGVVIVGALLVATMLAGRWFDVALIHVHNFVAVGLWLAWRERQRRWHLVPLAMVGVCSLAIVLWPAPLGFEWLAPASIPVRHHLATLAPGLPQGLAIPLVVLFAFMQSVHYGLWLRVVPEEDRDRHTPRTFRASLQALDRDVGPWLVRLVALASVGLALWAIADLYAARIGYLRFARFHAVLELCVVALVLVENRTIVSRREGGCPPRSCS
jgi:hypothetical protein